MSNDYVEKRFLEGRKIEIDGQGINLSKPQKTGDDKLDIIKLLRGTWVSQSSGWNLIALPASSLDLKDKPAFPSKSFRLLMNQYGETLKFNAPDTGVPNRGLIPDAAGGQTKVTTDEPDQLIDAIAYEQIVVQKEVADFPESISGVRAENGEPIHHEPGFFLQFLNHIPTGTSPDVEDGKATKTLSIARMGNIPHGNSVLAMGFVTHDPIIEDDDAFPERIEKNESNKKYFEPYDHFESHPFFGCVDTKKAPGFPGFFPSNVHAILQFVQNGLKVKKTTVLNFDTKFQSVNNNPESTPSSEIPISNIPFLKREANVTEMHASFWIMELEKENSCDSPKFVMQYSQTVYLEFFDSKVLGKDGKPLPIRWPHVSINTLIKIDP